MEQPESEARARQADQRHAGFLARQSEPLTEPAPKPAIKIAANKGAGYYYRRKNKATGEISGPWYFKIDINGKTIDKSTKCLDLKAARRRGNEIETAARADDLGWVTFIAPTVKQWYHTYYETFSKARKAPWTDEKALPFVEHYGNTRLDKITAEQCQQWINMRKKAISAKGEQYKESTVRTEIVVLRTLFNKAVASKRLKDSPWKGLTLPKKGEPNKRKMSLEEQARILPHLAPIYLRAVITLLGSGLRLAEFLALRPSDVRDGRIYIRESTAKFNKSRTVPIPAPVRAAIDQQRIARGLEWGDTGRLWHIGYATLGWNLRKACEAAGIEGEVISPHDLRRTYGSRMSECVKPRKLQELMGHSDIQITFKFYVTVDEEEMSVEVDAADLGLPV